MPVDDSIVTESEISFVADAIDDSNDDSVQQKKEMHIGLEQFEAEFLETTVALETNNLS